MVLLFNSSQWLQRSSDGLVESRQLILPADVLLKLEFEQVNIERAGQGWRFIGNGAFQFSPAHYASSWQSAVLKPIPQAQLDQGFVVTVWLAGKETSSIYTLLPFGDNIIVEHHGLTFQIENTSIDNLVPTPKN